MCLKQDQLLATALIISLQSSVFSLQSHPHSQPHPHHSSWVSYLFAKQTERVNAACTHNLDIKCGRLHQFVGVACLEFHKNQLIEFLDLRFLLG